MTWALVQTYRLGSEDETNEDIWQAAESAGVICDQSARTIADLYKTPNKRDAALLALAQGTGFDTEELRENIKTAGMEPDDRYALETWLEELEMMLGDLGEEAAL